MQFHTQTKPPEGQTVLSNAKNEQIKDLLFQAVMLYLENNESAKEEFLLLLQGKDEASVTS